MLSPSDSEKLMKAGTVWFQKTPRTEGWGQGPGSVDPRFPAGLLVLVPEILEFEFISRFGNIFPAIFPGLSRSFPREPPNRLWKQPQAPDLLSLPFWKTARKTTKKARISYACRTPKVLGKEGKTLKITRNSFKKEKGKEIQKGKDKKILGPSRVFWLTSRQRAENLVHRISVMVLGSRAPTRAPTRIDFPVFGLHGLSTNEAVHGSVQESAWGSAVLFSPVLFLDWQMKLGWQLCFSVSNSLVRKLLWNFPKAALQPKEFFKKWQKKWQKSLQHERADPFCKRERRRCNSIGGVLVDI